MRQKFEVQYPTCVKSCLVDRIITQLCLCSALYIQGGAAGLIFYLFNLEMQ